MSTFPPLTKLTGRIGLVRYSSVELLVSLILLFAATPFVEDLPSGNFVESVLLSLVLVSAGLAVGGKRRVFGIALLLLLPTLLAKWTHHLFPHLLSESAHLTLSLVFIAYVGFHLLGYVLRASRVDKEVLCAGISVFFMIGLLWTMAYVLVDQLSNGAFSFANDADKARTMNGFNAFYFSFTTLTTVGFGDISPVSKLARTLAIMEAITGMFYMAILISRLVSMYSPAARSTIAESETEP